MSKERSMITSAAAVEIIEIMKKYVKEENIKPLINEMNEVEGGTVFKQSMLKLKRAAYLYLIK